MQEKTLLMKTKTGCAITMESTEMGKDMERVIPMETGMVISRGITMEQDTATDLDMATDTAKAKNKRFYKTREAFLDEKPLVFLI